MLDSPIAVGFVYYLLPAVTVLTAGALTAWVVVAHRDATAATWILGLLVSGGTLNLFYLVITLSGNREIQQAMIYPRQIALIGFTAAFVLYCSAYTGRNFHRQRPVAAAMGAVFGSFVVLSVTEPVTELLFVAYRPRSEPFGYVVAEPSAIYVAFLVGIVAFTAYATYVMVDHLLSTKRRTGWQIVLFLVGAFTFSGFEVAGQLGLFPATGLSHAVYGVLPIFLLLAVALFQFDLLEVQPVARTAVVEQLRDPVVVLDSDRRVVDFNAASTRVWPGIDDAVSDPFERVCPALSQDVEVPPETDTVTEKIALTADGEDRFFSVTVSKVSRDGGSRLYSILLRDITELEQSLRQLQTQNERLDQVASTISHDLRNPINVAQGHADLLAELLAELELDPATERRANESIANVQQSHDRMLDIIDDILTIAREGKTVEETEPVELSTVAREAWNNVDTADATLTVADDRELSADRSKLMSIFENLFRNAIDHGRPDVEVGVSATEDGFAVQDDGPGIPPTHRDSVFEYGYTTESGNTGLGLSIVRTMAESHGWTVELDEVDDGTRFVFSTTRGSTLSGETDALHATTE